MYHFCTVSESEQKNEMTYLLVAQVFEKLFSHSYLWSNAGDDGASPEHSDMLRKEAGPIHGIIRRMGHHLDKQIASRTNLFEKYKDILDHNASGKYASSLSRWKDHQQLAVDKQRAYRVIVSEVCISITTVDGNHGSQLILNWFAAHFSQRTIRSCCAQVKKASKVYNGNEE
jgi:hypothetical protein